MKITIKLWSVVKCAALFSFVWVVALCESIGVSMPMEWRIATGHNVALMESNPVYMFKRILAQVIHQYPLVNGEVTIQQWVVQSIIVTVSAVAWGLFICCICYPRGFMLRGNNSEEHLKFSYTLAGITLFQIVANVRHGRSGPEDMQASVGDLFLWLPLLIIVAAALGLRIYRRLQAQVTGKRQELILLTPFFTGLALILLSWLPPINFLRFGSSIQLFSGSSFVNKYTLLYYPLMLLCVMAMFYLHKRFVVRTVNRV